MRFTKKKKYLHKKQHTAQERRRKVSVKNYLPFSLFKEILCVDL